MGRIEPQLRLPESAQQDQGMPLFSDDRMFPWRQVLPTALPGLPFR
jgi:hypothetical protein